MAENEDGSGNGMLATFVIGGLIGAGVALLFAPAAGEDTRDRVSSWIKEGSRKTREYLAEKRESWDTEAERRDSSFPGGRDSYREPKNSGKNDQRGHHKSSVSVG